VNEEKEAPGGADEPGEGDGELGFARGGHEGGIIACGGGGVQRGWVVMLGK
jgi:hypothetical protein